MSQQIGDVRITVFGRTDVGAVRTNNEDAFVIADLNAGTGDPSSWNGARPVGERGVLLAVSDGMGGAAAGEIASAITVESLREWLGQEHGRIATGDLVESAVGNANRNVFDAAQEAERQGMGATLTAILVRGATAHIAEVGDSRAYLIRKGRIRQVTRDQSFVEMLVEQGLITREQAEHSPYKNVILQAMGQRPGVSVALCRLELRRGDRIVLCSDGLTNKVNDDEIRDILEMEPDLEAACGRLIALANERGGEDNITLVVGVVDGDGLPAVGSGENITRTLSDLKVFDPEEHKKPKAAPAPPPPPVQEPGSDITQLMTVGDLPLEAQIATVPASAPAAAFAPPASAPASSSKAWMWIAIVVIGLVAAGIGYALSR